MKLKRLHSQTAIEAGAGEFAILDPLVFNFSNLAPIAAGETGFNLDLSFTDIDLNDTNEFLATSINSDGNTYNLGNFPVTFTETTIFNASGNGNLFVDFSSIGGSFGDSLTVTLAPAIGSVQFITPIGFADLTLSYEAGDPNSEKVPEPMTDFVLAAGLGGAALRRAKSRKS